MAAGNTSDIRPHVLGDLYMLTGTFTDGGTDVSYADHLSEVLAAGGHVTSLYDTGIKINEGDNIVVGETAMTVDTVDARLHFNIGETVYTSTGARVGAITALGATTVTIGAGAAVAMTNNDNLFKLGPDQSAVTLNDGSLAVSIDETNKFVVFGNGNLGAASTAHTQDGRWWILDKR